MSTISSYYAPISAFKSVRSDYLNQFLRFECHFLIPDLKTNASALISVETLKNTYHSKKKILEIKTIQ
jgi:hypothetical protein